METVDAVIVDARGGAQTGVEFIFCEPHAGILRRRQRHIDGGLVAPVRQFTGGHQAIAMPAAGHYGAFAYRCIDTKIIIGKISEVQTAYGHTYLAQSQSESRSEILAYPHLLDADIGLARAYGIDGGHGAQPVFYLQLSGGAPAAGKGIVDFNGNMAEVGAAQMARLVLAFEGSAPWFCAVAALEVGDCA